MAATIEPMTLSDHHSISVTLTFPNKITHTQIWRLDSNILTDKIREAEICKCLVEYFNENNTPENFKLTQWEAHKCVIRGKLISLAAAIKKEKKARLTELFTKLRTLEMIHKRNLAQKSYMELTETHVLLQEELGRNLRKKIHYHRSSLINLEIHVTVY